jgi:uncharacterized transporter YbjL
MSYFYKARDPLDYSYVYSTLTLQFTIWILAIGLSAYGLSKIIQSLFKRGRLILLTILIWALILSLYLTFQIIMSVPSSWTNGINGKQLQDISDDGEPFCSINIP